MAPSDLNNEERNEGAPSNDEGTENFTPKNEEKAKGQLSTTPPPANDESGKEGDGKEDDGKEETVNEKEEADKKEEEAARKRETKIRENNEEIEDHRLAIGELTEENKKLAQGDKKVDEPGAKGAPYGGNDRTGRCTA